MEPIRNKKKTLYGLAPVRQESIITKRDMTPVRKIPTLNGLSPVIDSGFASLPTAATEEEVTEPGRYSYTDLKADVVSSKRRRSR